MISQEAKDNIKVLICQLISNDEAFSAYDVTLMARKNGINERHYEMKEVVHNEFRNGNMGQYLRTPHDFNGNEAYVYHPADVDPHTRQKLPSVASSPKVFTVLDAAAIRNIPLDQASDWRKSLVPSPVPPIKPISNIGFDGSLKPDPKTRFLSSSPKTVDLDADVLYVPSEYVKILGLVPGDKVDISRGADNIKIYKQGDNQIRSVSVDLRGNISIKTRHLKRIGVRKAVVFSASKSYIEIRPFSV